MQYKLKRSKRARAMRLEVSPDGALVVTAPTYFGIRVIEYFLAKHAAWVQRKVEETKGRTVVRIARRDIPELKNKALEFAQARCEYYARLYGIPFRSITIRAQKTRWGSCSHKGNLSFNYRIAALPAHLAEYIIVHEMCHLLELNHSARYWRHVERCVPDHARLRKELRTIVTVFV